MRKISIYVLLAVTFVASCRKYDDDHAFDKSPDERINETLGAYQTALTAATDGWNGAITTGDGSYFRFYFRFNNSNRVVMFGDFSNETARTPRESSYRLKALQQPALIFDTYSYLHILADPDAAANNGVYGAGRVSDFEYAIDTVTADSVKLTGRFNGTKMNLWKATAAERAGWESQTVSNAITGLRDLSKILQYFKRLTYNGAQYELQLDTFAKKANVSWIDGTGTPQTVSRSYYFVPGGIAFTDPIVNGSITIPGFTIVSFNNGTLVMNVSVSGSSATITGANAPINPDKTAFSRFWQQALADDIYWVTFDGFHVNGVDDAYNINSLQTDTSEFYYWLYWPGAGASYDAFAPIFLNRGANAVELYYGTGNSPATLSDGRTRFNNEVVTIGRSAFPTTGPADLTRKQFRLASGYWFVQTSSTSYDMVSVADAKVWLTWYYIF